MIRDGVARQQKTSGCHFRLGVDRAQSTDGKAKNGLENAGDDGSDTVAPSTIA